MKSKSITYFLTCLIFIFCLPLTCFATPSVQSTLQLDPHSTPDTPSIQLTLASTEQRVYAVDLTLNYDLNHLILSDISTTNPDLIYFTQELSPGNLRVLLAIPEGVLDTQTLLTFHFTPLSNKSTVLQLNPIEAGIVSNGQSYSVSVPSYTLALNE